MTELLAWSSLQYLYDFTQCAICENEPNVITFVLKEKPISRIWTAVFSCTCHLLYIFVNQNYRIGFMPG